MGRLKMLSLFSGIGGIDLAAEWTGGIDTAAFVEINAYCRKILSKHWPDVPILEDVKLLTKESLIQEGVIDSETGAGIDIICGGFP